MMLSSNKDSGRSAWRASSWRLGARKLIVGGLLAGAWLSASAPARAQTLSEISERWERLQERQAWAEAKTLLTDAIAAHPDQEWLYINLGATLRELGRYDEAIGTLASARVRFPDSGRLSESLALAYIKRGEARAASEGPEAALTDYKSAVDLQPQRDYVILNYALALNNAERYEPAIAEYRRGIALHPEYPHYKRNLIWTYVRFIAQLNQAAAESEAERVRVRTRTLQLASEAYALDPQHRGALQAYSQSLIDAGRPAEALPVLHDALRLFPGDRAFCWPLSLAYGARVDQLHRSADAAERRAATTLVFEIPALIRGEPECDSSLLLEFDRLAARLGAFERSIPALESIADKYQNDAIYAEQAGRHMNRYAVWLRTVAAEPERARIMREKANERLRRAMRIYEAQHPARPRPSGAVRFPLEGRALVVASFDSGGTHSGFGKYCYDLIGVGENGSTVRVGESGDRNEHFVGFGQAVLAAKDGVVDVVDDGDPDPEPNAVQYETDGNYVRVRHADGTYGWYVHLKNGSVRVQVGQTVRAGQPLGSLGNSGMSVSPHLHFCLITDDYVSVDFRFEPLNVRRAVGEPPARTAEPLESGWQVWR